MLTLTLSRALLNKGTDFQSPQRTVVTKWSLCLCLCLCMTIYRIIESQILLLLEYISENVSMIKDASMEPSFNKGWKTKKQSKYLQWMEHSRFQKHRAFTQVCLAFSLAWYYLWDTILPHKNKQANNLWNAKFALFLLPIIMLFAFYLWQLRAKAKAVKWDNLSLP